ncbi:mitochondrial inner membrane i-AAA protease supercomplex subunit Yme1p [Trichomonascus vanleenenianus]|uniref:i-AAA protease YME1 n=1 Tax=Trichomonascus vanleenenianus TaxID=2268995 RepID=UPI003ECB0750
MLFSTKSFQAAPAGSYTTYQLSQSEQKANRGLTNARLQADFYRKLLASNYPHLVVSRYESPGVAKNTECDALYIQALKSIGHTDKAEAIEKSILANSAPEEAFGGHSMMMGSTAVSEGMNGSNGLVAGHVFSGGAGRGTKGDPVHVIITETAMSSLLKWLKWLIPMGLAGWGLVVGLTFFTESASILKGGTPDLSTAKMDGANGTTSNVKFTDVHGVDEARAELEEIVEFLKDPSKFTGLGGKLPKGILLTGPPGTGKTLLARAVAGEAGVPFFFMSGSEFDELYVGVGAKRVRELFAAARAKAPAIVFIDELDAIGSKRNPKDHAYSKQTLNQLLVDLDGFSQTTGVIFIAATNFPETLDKALTRPGRFDKIVHVELPDVRGRIAILKHHMKKVETAPTVDPALLARGTAGFSGADLMNLVNQAAIYASRSKAVSVDMSHFEWAKDKLLLGAARQTMVLTEESRENTAYHEAGHAIMAMYTPGATSLYKATILPRGSALGITFQLPEMDKYDQTRRELLAKLDVCMGGKIAEELTRGSDFVTSGCSSDLKSATQVARAMVTAFGMSDAIGPVDLSENWSEWSADTKHLAEQQIRTLLQESEKRTRQMLADKRVELERLAQGLLEYETLDKDEMEKVVRGHKLDRERTVTNTVVKSSDIRDPRGEGEEVSGLGAPIS